MANQMMSERQIVRPPLAPRVERGPADGLPRAQTEAPRPAANQRVTDLASEPPLSPAARDPVEPSRRPRQRVQRQAANQKTANRMAVSRPPVPQLVSALAEALRWARARVPQQAANQMMTRARRQVHRQAINPKRADPTADSGPPVRQAAAHLVELLSRAPL